MATTTENKRVLIRLTDLMNSNAILKIIAKVVLYGAVINFAMTFIFGLPINALTFLAYGIAWHFITDEIPSAVNNYRIRK